jgi:hypothetical protein
VTRKRELRLGENRIDLLEMMDNLFFKMWIGIWINDTEYILNLGDLDNILNWIGDNGVEFLIE